MKDILKGLYETYREFLAMSEEEIMNEYGDKKSDIIADIESEIDYYESKMNEKPSGMIYDVDPAFSSWEQVNRMFV